MIMLRLSLACALLISVALPQTSIAQDNPQSGNARVHLHWGARPGVSRYRLQLAADSGFHDIVVDRIVKGTEIDINDLPSGKYFWRFAPLTKTLGEFSSAAPIDTSQAATNAPALPSSSPPVATVPTSTSKAIATSGGWHAVVGDVARP